MKTTKELIAEVDGELNAVRAADMGLEAIQAFAQEAVNQFAAGDVVKTKEHLDNLLSLVVELRKAVPANVVPSTAGPTGKSASEQDLENALAVTNEHLGKMQAALPGVLKTIQDLGSVIDLGIQAKQVAVAGLANKALADGNAKPKAAA